MLEPRLSSPQSTFNAGLEGYKNGSQTMSNASRNLTNGHSRQEVNTAALDLVSGSVQAQASATVMSGADSMLGTIIDTFA